MKKSILQCLFGFHSVRQNHSKSISKRSLGMEPLEERQMLSADWGNYEAPKELLELPSIPGKACDLIQFADINKDGNDDYITVDFSSGDVYVFMGDGEGSFSNTAITTSLSNAGMSQSETAVAVLFGNFDSTNGNTANNDLMVITGNVDGSLAISVYCSKTDGTFNTTAASYTINENVFSSSYGLFPELKACVSSTTNSVSKLVVQMEYISIVNTAGSTPTMVVSSYIYGWNFNSSTKKFVDAANPTKYYQDSDTGRILLNVIQAEYNGSTEEFLVTSGEPNQSSTTQTNSFQLDFKSITPESTGSDAVFHQKSWVYNTTNLGNLTIDWLLPDYSVGEFVVGGNNLVASVLLTDLAYSDSFAPTITISNLGFNVNDSSVATTRINGVSNDRLLYVMNSNRLIVLEGDNFTLQETVENPTFHSSYIVDIIGADGINDILLVDSTALWVYNGATGEYRFLATLGLGTNLTKAAFLSLNGTDLGVAVMSAGTTVVDYYLIQTTDNGTTFNILHNKNFLLGVGNQNYNIIDIAVGDFNGDGLDNLALLGQYRGGTETETSANLRALGIFGNDSGNAIYAESFSVASGEEFTAITAGNTNFNSKDEIILTRFVGTTAYLRLYEYDTTFKTTKEFTIQSSNVNSVSDVINVVVDDINNDSYNDIIYLYSSASGNSKLGYLENNVENNFTDKTLVNLDSTITSWSGLFYNYIDQDEYKDILFTGTNSANQTYIYTLQGKASGFESTLKRSSTAATVSGFSSAAISVGKLAVEGVQNNSNDVIIVHGDELWFWNNSAVSSGTCGAITILCQSLSNQDSTGSNFTADQASARTWIDEWSNFYMDIWGTTDGGGVLTSFSVQLNYNPVYFSVKTENSAPVILAGTGVTITEKVVNAEDGSITISGTIDRTAGLGNTENSLLVRVRFTPTQGSNKGVPLPEDGVFKSVANDFTVDATQNSLNGLAVLTADDPEIPLYPVIYDLNEDGYVNIDDFYRFAMVYSKFQTNSPLWDQDASLKVCDYNNDTFININDFYAWADYYSKKNIKTTGDSLYANDYVFPTETQSSTIPVVQEEVFALENDIIEEEEVLPAAVVENQYLYLPIEQNNGKKSIFDSEENNLDGAAKYDVVDDMVTEFLTRSTGRETETVSSSKTFFAYQD